MHQLGDFDLIILNDVSGFDLSLSKMQQLERYVCDFGGGLVMLAANTPMPQAATTERRWDDCCQ
jgi:hypothetical protein